jgi:LysR family nitrogen assimilation transcriptional regulator
MIDPEMAQLFLDVAEAGSLSKAAERIGKSQPYISRAIVRLEADWGGPLFRRTGRGVALTDFGETVLPQVRSWLLETQSLLESFKSYSGNPNGEVTIGSLPSTSSPIMSALFVRMRQRMPGIRLRFKEGYNNQIQSWLASGQVDIGIVLSYNSDRGVGDIPLVEFPTYLCGAAGDAITSQPTVEFTELLDLPMTLPANPGVLTRHLEFLCAEYGRSVNAILEVNSLAMQRDIVASGAAYSILSYSAVADEVRRERIQASRIVSPGIVQYLSIGLAKHGPLTKVTREVIRELRAVVHELHVHEAPEQA